MKINLAGDTVGDLINALRQLDPDTKTEVTAVGEDVHKRRELVLWPNDKERIDCLRDKIEEVPEWLDDNSMNFEERVSEARAACKRALMI